MPKLRREASGDVIDTTYTLSACAEFDAYISSGVYQLWGVLYG